MNAIARIRSLEANLKERVESVRLITAEIDKQAIPIMSEIHDVYQSHEAGHLSTHQAVLTMAAIFDKE